MHLFILKKSDIEIEWTVWFIAVLEHAMLSVSLCSLGREHLNYTHTHTHFFLTGEGEISK